MQRRYVTIKLLIYCSLKRQFTITTQISENVSNSIRQIEGYLRNSLLQSKCKLDANEIIERRVLELQKITRDKRCQNTQLGRTLRSSESIC